MPATRPRQPVLAYFLLNDNRFVLEGARRTATGGYHDGTSTGEVTLYEFEGGPTLGGTAWPRTLAYQAGTLGNFAADIPQEVSDLLEPGQVIWWRVTLLAADGKRYGDAGSARCKYPSGP